MNKFLFIIAIVISSNAYSVIPEVKFDDWSVWEDQNGKINAVVEPTPQKGFGLACVSSGHMVVRIIFPESEKGMSKLKPESTVDVDYSFSHGSSLPGTLEGYVMKHSGAVIINFTSIKGMEIGDWYGVLKEAESQGAKVIYSIESPEGVKYHLTFSLNGYMKAVKNMIQKCMPS